MSKQELTALGIEQPDFLYVSGDAYIDHPSFGPAIICRVLQSRGYTVAVISQPDWHDTVDFLALGRPRLGVLISSGNIDSMVNHYTAAKKHRREDAYTPGGRAGARPDRAVVVYANRAREAFPGLPVIIGGIEASLRRFAHYDYWDDRVRHSIIIDSGADLLIYGMGERQIVEIADALNAGTPVRDVTNVRGTCFAAATDEGLGEYQALPDYGDVAKDKKLYAQAFMQQYRAQDAIKGKRLVQRHEKRYVVVNPPALPLTREELDAVYDLPYTRRPHPIYGGAHIPALDEVEFSLTSCRGCFGGCSFCALTFHQGRVVQSRSHASLVREAEKLTKLPDFKGYIHDVGGPTANFRQPACSKQLKSGVCPDRNCLGYKKCPNLQVSHSDYVQLLRTLRNVKGVKKVFVRSGVRYDYAMYDRDDTFMRELIKYHISGQLKVAPEHVSDRVLELMDKPANTLYNSFVQRYKQLNQNEGMDQYIVPYFMSSHPGSDLNAAIELALYLKSTGQRPEQVQDFYPTPGTLSTCMYYTGLDPRTMQQVYVPRSMREKEMQRALIQYYMPQYRDKARRALIEAEREDLIGFHKGALLPPKREYAEPMGRGDKSHSDKSHSDKASGRTARPARSAKPRTQDARGAGRSENARKGKKPVDKRGGRPYNK